MSPRQSEFSPQASIELHIDELVVHGLPLTDSQGRLVQAAVETELARLLLQRGIDCSSDSRISHVSGSTIPFARNIEPMHLGQQIAQAVYVGLTSKPTATRPTHDSKGTIQ